MNSIAILLSFCFLGCVWGANVVTQCDTDTKPLYTAVTVLVNGTECTTSPCQFKRGVNASCEVTFTAVNSITKLSKKVIATVISEGISTAFPLPDADKGCDNLLNGGYCPLDKGEEATLALTMPVSKDYPLVQLKLEFSLVDQLNGKNACFVVFANVVD